MSDEGDLARTLAFAFQRRGVATMERTKLLAILAFDLRWFSPDPAKRVIQRGIKAGLLEEQGESVKVAFDANEVDIPLNFKPSGSLGDEEGPVGVPMRAPKPQRPQAPAASGASDDGASKERLRRGGLIWLDVAALIVARRSGRDVRAEAQALEAALVSAARR